MRRGRREKLYWSTESLTEHLVSLLSVVKASPFLASKMKIPGVEGTPGLISGLVVSSLIARWCPERACRALEPGGAGPECRQKSVPLAKVSFC